MRRRIRPLPELIRLVVAACALVILVGALPSAATAATVTETFGYTGAVQTWTVPAGVTSATFDLHGAAGGAGPGGVPSRGGRATATIAVTPGDVIEVYVGGQGRDVNAGFGTGGFNGGGTVGRMTGGDGRFTQDCFNLFGQRPGSGGTQSQGGTNVDAAGAAGSLGAGGPAVGDGGGGDGG
jgi:hypothetical protein